MSQLKTQLKNLSDQQKSKTLKVWEEELELKQKLLDDPEKLLQAEVLDKRIEAQTAKLDGISKAIIEQEKKLDAKRIEVLDNIQQLGRKSDTILKASKEEEKRLKELTDKTIITVANLATIKEAVKEQKDYLASQQKLVDDTIAELNNSLRENAQEINDQLEEKKQISTDIIRHTQGATDIKEQINGLEGKLKGLDLTYNQKVTSYREKLQIIKDEIVVKNLEVEASNLEIEDNKRLEIERIKLIDSKEKSLITSPLQ
jgi:chromosome segregation ATPase